MTRYAGYDGSKIKYVGSAIHELGLWSKHFVTLPPELEKLSATDLMRNYEVRRKQVVPVGERPERIAVVSTWGVRCGIATYSEDLVWQLRKHVPVRVFAEDYWERFAPRGGVPQDDVVRCWQRGQSLSRLATELKMWEPDVILIQHEYGLFPTATHWLSFMNAIAGYRVLVTLHGVYEHMDKTVVEASIPEMIVHTQGAHDLLRSTKQVNGSINIIPHGCWPMHRERYWNIYRSNQTLLQAGFGFKYKGWENSLKLVAELKQRYPAIFLTGIFGETADGSSKAYFSEINKLVGDLGVRDHVGLVQGFQSDVVLNAFARTNAMAILPYIKNNQHVVYGASGIARVLMSKGLPVVGAPVPLFEDLRGVIPLPKPDQMADEISALFDNRDLVKAQLDAQERFLSENSWENVAAKYLKVMGV